MLVLWFALSASAADACTPVGLGRALSEPAPAVLVLGERKGTQPDLARAERVVRRLARKGAVTLALESVHRAQQPVLDRYARGELAPSDLPGLLGWKSHWGFDWAPYQDLVTAAVDGVTVAAVGLDVEARPPEDAEVQVPPGYTHVLHDAMGQHAMPPRLSMDFASWMAWRDRSIAEAALQAWNGEGYLVILADRLHVEGGKGIAWQAERLTEVPVRALLLADEGACYPGDRYLADDWVTRLVEKARRPADPGPTGRAPAR